MSNEEGKQIEAALKQILDDLNNHKLEIDNTQEDIHSFVESTLIQRIGNVGKNYIPVEVEMTKLP